jgi:hypothetical protein
MIQRIQTVYLLLSMIFLSVVSFGMTFIAFVEGEKSYELTSFGVLIKDEQGNILEKMSNPFYLTTFVLIVLCFVSMMSYKNLNRQLRLVRMTFYLYLLVTIGLIIFSVSGASFLDLSNAKRELGLAYILFVCGLPFVFLANIGVKRDKNLIDSLNRLR